MLPFAPMQLLDDFLINYNIGQALLLLFVLSLPVGYVRGSRKITAINLALFGAIFVVIPSIGGGSSLFAFLGIALLVLAPMLYATAER
mgnify:CR=1 FL=1